MRYRLIPMVFTAFLCTACSTMTPDTQQQATSNEWRLQNLESRFLEYQENNKKQEAETKARLKAMEARVENATQIAKSAKDIASQSQADASSLKEAIIAQSMQEESSKASTKTAISKPQTTGSSAPKAASKPVAKAPRPSAKPAAIVSAAEIAYQKALNNVRSGNAVKGRKGLDTFLGNHPKSPLVPNALYWLGETYYHEKRYAQSILTFKDVIRRFPKHNKAAAAMLKIGFSYKQLGDIANAKFYLQALIEDYPSSGPAQIARKSLASM